MVPKTTIDVKRGDSVVVDLAITRSNAAVNLTGATLRGTIKTDTSIADPGTGQISSPSSGITITNAAGGLATAEWPASTFNSITQPGVYIADIQLTESTGRVSTVHEIEMNVTLDVTRTSP